MRLRFILIHFFILGIITACDNEKIEPVQPAKLRTDDTITVTNINPESAIPSSTLGVYNLLGYGYDVTGQFADASAARHHIINVVKLKENEPDRVQIGRTNAYSFKSFASKSCENYSQIISASTNATEGSKLFKGAITTYFPDQDALSDKYIYSGYTSTLERKRIYMESAPDLLQKYITDAFKSDIQSQSPQNIVKKYGAHILTAIKLGAKLVVLYQAETENTDRYKAAQLGLTVAMKNVFKLPTGYLDYFNATSATGNFSQKLSYQIAGGEKNKLFQATSLGAKYPTVDISSWSQSLTNANEEFIDFMPNNALLLLYEVIEDPIKKEEVKQYIQAYLAENQVEL